MPPIFRFFSSIDAVEGNSDDDDDDSDDGNNGDFEEFVDEPFVEVARLGGLKRVRQG